MGVLWIPFIAQALAECSLPRSASELDATVGQAELAWETDPSTFAQALGEVEGVLACVNVPVAVPMAARLLRLDGLRAFGARDAGRSAAAFASARRLDPNLDMSEEMAPSGNPLRALWDTPLTQGAPLPLRGARKGKLYVDGSAATTVPADQPVVFQWVDGVRVSAGLATAAALPSYPKKLHPAHSPLLASSGVLAVGAGVLYGLAWQANADFEAASDLASLEDARDRSRTLTYASAGAGGAAVLALGGALVVAKF